MFGTSKPSNLFNTSQPASQQNTTETGAGMGQNTGIFGNNAPTLGNGLFGNQNNVTGPTQQQQLQQQQQSNSQFGNTAAPGGGLNGSVGSFSKPGVTGSSSLFGNNNTANIGNNNTNNNQLQQAQASQNMITPFTRPSDLPESFQKELENTDAYIRQQAQLSEDLAHAIDDHQVLVNSIPRDVQLIKFKLTSAKETLRFDDNQLAQLKKLVDTDFSDAELLADVTNQPRKYDRLLPYFQRVVDCENRLDQLALAMRDIQHAVTAEEFGKRSTYDFQGLQALPQALKEEYFYFMNLSDRVAELHRHIKDREEGETLDEMQV